MTIAHDKLIATLVEHMDVSRKLVVAIEHALPEEVRAIWPTATRIVCRPNDERLDFTLRIEEVHGPDGLITDEPSLTEDGTLAPHYDAVLDIDSNLDRWAMLTGTEHEHTFDLGTLPSILPSDDGQWLEASIDGALTVADLIAILSTVPPSTQVVLDDDESWYHNVGQVDLPNPDREDTIPTVNLRPGAPFDPRQV